MLHDAPPDFLVVEDDDDDFFLVQDLLRGEMWDQKAGLAARDARQAPAPEPAFPQTEPRVAISEPPVPYLVNVEQARSVDEALDRIAARPYALILLDYSLGARNGLDLLGEMRARDNSTPVIFLTAHGDEQIAVRALKGGAIDYLSKSKLTRDTLSAAVRHALALRDRDAAVREARDALAAREREYRMLFEKANDAIFIIDPATENILEANPAASRLYGIDHDRLVGRSLIEFSTDIVRGRRAIEECMAGGELVNFQAAHVANGGRRIDVLASGSVIEYRGRRALLALFRDITEREAAQQEIFRLNRALKALSKCNEALLRAREPQQFLDEICDIMVQVGGYRMAWVAEAPNVRNVRIRPLAIAGTDREYVEIVCERYGALDSSPLLVPTAIRTGVPAVCRDTAGGPLATRKECAERGFSSIIALPITRDSRVFGALAIYAGDCDAFDNPEVELLRELAGNVSYGLESLDARNQREIAQAELKASEARLRNLLDTANEGVWTLDREGRITFVNEGMAAMLGRAPAEMLGHFVWEFAPSERKDLIESSIHSKCDIASARAHLDGLMARADGSSVYVSINTSAVVDAEGNMIGLLAMISDVTEQKRAEDRLRDSERRYRMLFERNLAGVFRTTSEGTILEANEAFVRMLGYATCDELRAINLPEMCAAAGCPERWCEKVKQRGQLVNQEISVLRKDGGTAYLLANFIALGDGAAANPSDSGATGSIEGTVLDVTERRQLQAQLLQSQKMDAIGQLAGGIAHDFNNLLMVMRSYAEMSGEAVADPAVKRQLESIMKAADRGAALTRQLLTFGRKQTFSPRVLELNGLLENLTKVLPRALGEDVVVEFHATTGLWQVKADPVQIEQLLLNLAVNARDAMPSGGRLTLETANTFLDSDYVKMHAGVPPGEYVMLAVSDTGHGISPEVLPRIFEPFFTTKERDKGTGLGLATVYGIVRQCGGFIWVYSEVGHGTVFKIYLPRVGVSEARGANGERQGNGDKPGTAAVGSETILVVEDEEAVRCATRDYLARRGYRVFEASSGEEALRSSDTCGCAIDLLITDAVMPGMSGMLLAQKMLERRPGIRILCVSGYTESSMAAHGLSPTAAFLQKPFSLAALAAKVRELLDSRPAEQLQQEQIVA